MTVCKSYVGYYIPMSVIVALKFDERFGTARFLKVKHKASSNAFLIYKVLIPHPPLGGLRHKNDAKLQKYWFTNKKLLIFFDLE